MRVPLVVLSKKLDSSSGFSTCSGGNVVDFDFRSTSENCWAECRRAQAFRHHDSKDYESSLKILGQG